MTCITARQIRCKAASEVLWVAVDFSPKLQSGELLTGTPTVLEVTSTDLTLANKNISTTALTINENEVASAAAVVFTVAGGSATGGPNSDGCYTIRCTATSDNATQAQTLIVDVLLEVHA